MTMNPASTEDSIRYLTFDELCGERLAGLREAAGFFRSSTLNPEMAVAQVDDHAFDFFVY